MLLTVFTTAYNRPKELRRLYGSLVRQTCRDFVWLIVDDSTDERVRQVVEELKDEGIIGIDYHRQEHRGKHWAQRLGFSLVKTPYVVDIDDDDELTDDCVEVLLREWKRIEEEGRTDIGMVCGLSMNANDEILCYHDDRDSIDTDYIEMEWTWHHPSENLLSRRTETIEKAHVFCDDGKWLYDQVSLVRESVLWNRIAKKYRSRYLNHPMRVYHEEGEERLSRPAFNRPTCINYVFSNYVMVNELRGHWTENIHDLVKYLAEYMACGMALKISFRQLIRTIEGWGPKAICVMLSPAAWLVGAYFRKDTDLNRSLTDKLI